MVKGLAKRVLHSILIIGLLALLLTGCGEDPQQGLPGGAAPAVIELWHSLTGAEAQELGKQSQRVMDAHPEVIIRLEYIEEEKMANLAYLAQAGGEGPEIFLTSAKALTNLFHQGALAPVIGNSDPFLGLVTQFNYGEKTYALPLSVDVPLFYYRTDVAPLPANLAEFSAAKGVIALSALDTKTLSPWWLAQGGKFASNGQPALQDPANLIFLQQLLAWREGNLLLVDPNAWNLFVNAQVAYTVASASQAQGLAATIPWGSVPLTQLTGGKGEILTGRTIGIANSSIKSTEELNPLIRLVEDELLSPDAQWAIAKAGKRFPASSSFYSREEAQTGLLRQVGLSLARVWSLPGNAMEGKLLPLQDQAWQKAWSGVKPEDALSWAQTEAVKVLQAK
ncbi:ABC-type sugar transport system, periplasmic component [Desulfitobacterium dichloroeliminans LMG P-21439]|uniref:ABC-type sugar transport system, periplasmic component n=1 Tax=Desulfitobacterium dichloroeliminans (strain LMG P-21439 / DCA1) TaxID=871963 RepID=L0FCN4_DESDL|nr:extracellular solute-binding protein [Desulfitobacterium dichloroeliminans]AGA70770.1 ABC-type sugar transport system, periplasmic component [Desulfitobacterium dichloroeliminans LMG P-21439]